MWVFFFHWKWDGLDVPLQEGGGVLAWFKISELLSTSPADGSIKFGHAIVSSIAKNNQANQSVVGGIKNEDFPVPEPEKLEQKNGHKISQHNLTSCC